MRAPRASLAQVASVFVFSFLGLAPGADAAIVDEFDDDSAWTRDEPDSTASIDVVHGRYVLVLAVTGIDALVASQRRGLGESSALLGLLQALGRRRPRPGLLAG